MFYACSSFRLFQLVAPKFGVFFLVIGASLFSQRVRVVYTSSTETTVVVYSNSVRMYPVIPLIHVCAFTLRLYNSGVYNTNGAHTCICAYVYMVSHVCSKYIHLELILQTV